MADRLKELIDKAEKAYGQMYDAEMPLKATGHFLDAEKHLQGAIDLANQMEMREKVIWLENRLKHAQTVYRSQFS